jgi:hypothetical protein
VEATIPGSKAFQREVDDGHLTVFLSVDDGLVHLSISHRVDVLGSRRTEPGRYPTWDEIVDARYLFCPEDKVMAMLLPPKSEYVNVHPTTFHLWEIKD